MIIFTAAVLTAALLNGNKNTKPEETQMAEIAKEQTEEPAVAANTDNTAFYLYVIRDNDGRLVVYDAQSMEVYLETGIKTEELSPELKERLTAGIGFEDPESLFDFLESYSS